MKVSDKGCEFEYRGRMYTGGAVKIFEVGSNDEVGKVRKVCGVKNGGGMFGESESRSE